MTILCAVGTSSRAARVADAARRLGAAAGEPVVLVHVFDPMAVPATPADRMDTLQSTDRVEELWRTRARAALAEVAAPGGETAVLAEGDPRTEILRLVREQGARLLLIGSAAREPLERIMQGSLSAELVREASCPVLVLTDAAEPRDEGPILAGYDGSQHSLRAARHAAALATVLHRDLVLLHVVAPGESRVRPDEELARELQAAASTCVSDAGVRLQAAVAVDHGEPAERLLHAATARGASLLVVGNRGRNALAAAVLGSVSALVVRQADRPVVVAGPRSELA